MAVDINMVSENIKNNATVSCKYKFLFALRISAECVGSRRVPFIGNSNVGA
jgi:hypothetical protein